MPSPDLLSRAAPSTFLLGAFPMAAATAATGAPGTAPAQAAADFDGTLDQALRSAALDTGAASRPVNPAMRRLTGATQVSKAAASAVEPATKPQLAAGRPSTAVPVPKASAGAAAMRTKPGPTAPTASTPAAGHGLDAAAAPKGVMAATASEPIGPTAPPPSPGPAWSPATVEAGAAVAAAAPGDAGAAEAPTAWVPPGDNPGPTGPAPDASPTARSRERRADAAPGTDAPAPPPSSAPTPPAPPPIPASAGPSLHEPATAPTPGVARLSASDQPLAAPAPGAQAGAAVRPATFARQATALTTPAPLAGGVSGQTPHRLGPPNLIQTRSAGDQATPAIPPMAVSNIDPATQPPPPLAAAIPRVADAPNRPTILPAHAGLQAPAAQVGGVVADAPAGPRGPRGWRKR